MHILQILMRSDFGCHETRGGAEEGLTNRLGVIEVIPATLYVRFDKLQADKTHLVASAWKVRLR